MILDQKLMKNQRGGERYFVCKIDQHHFVAFVKMLKKTKFLLGFFMVCRLTGMHVFVKFVAPLH